MKSPSDSRVATTMRRRYSEMEQLLSYSQLSTSCTQRRRHQGEQEVSICWYFVNINHLGFTFMLPQAPRTRTRFSSQAFQPESLSVRCRPLLRSSVGRRLLGLAGYAFRILEGRSGGCNANCSLSPPSGPSLYRRTERPTSTLLMKCVGISISPTNNIWRQLGNIAR